MQATHELYIDNPSSSTPLLQKRFQHEDMKGAQFIVQSNLKIMSRSIAALSKISEDVLIEVSESGLFFKIVNRSKYCVLRFATGFFNSSDLTMISEKDLNICRLSMKSAQRIFKGVTFGEKNFVGCEFRIDPKAEKMMVKLQMNYDINRTIYAKLREMGTILHKPTYDKCKCRNTTVVFASVLIPILGQMKTEIEVTMKVTKNGLTIRNFHSMDGISMFNASDPKNGKKVKTETTITVDKLTRHKVSIPVEFSFSLKEFVSIVTFADQLGSEVCLYYDLPGRPLVLSIEAHASFDIELALATMGSDDEIDLDGGIIKETLINSEATASVQQKDKTRKSNKSDLSEFIAEKSESRCRINSIQLTQEDCSRKRTLSERRSHPQPSKSSIVASKSVQEATTLPIADHTWRDHEITRDEQKGHSQGKRQIELRTEPEEMEVDQQQDTNYVDDHTLRQGMQDISILTPVQVNVIPEAIPMDEDLNHTMNGSEPHDMIRNEYEETDQLLGDPQPKRMKTNGYRNIEIRRIVLGVESQERMTMSEQFRGTPLVKDTQY